ncbi:hypothetical protein [Enterococcus sp. DIV0876]|uniref:hypothetical protein n=1 Tax=Enterococcus sp. DIV0876 TaxID=2774633 RepID=UPI003D2FA4C3
MIIHKQGKSKGSKKHKSNRYSILMLALIFIGFATYGTYAYFTDSTSVGTDIELTAGTVNLGEAKEGKWKYVNWNSTYNRGKELTQNNELELTGDSSSNLQPGDAFEKTIMVKYQGSLDAKINVENVSEVINEIQAQNFDATITINHGDDTEFIVKQDADIIISIKVGLPYIPDEEAYTSDSNGTSRNAHQGIDLNEVTKELKITASQITETSTSK